MAATPEDLALELSRESLSSQAATENQLREKATSVLSAASIAVPVAALALREASHLALVPIVIGVIAALSFIASVTYSARALVPKNIQTGLLGGEVLELARDSDADFRQMQYSAASYIDSLYRNNQAVLERSSKSLERAIQWLVAEIVFLVSVIGSNLIAS